MSRYASFFLLVLLSNATAEKVEADRFNQADGSELLKVSVINKMHPLRDLKPFWIGKGRITNRQYLRFVKASGYSETDSRWESSAAENGLEEAVQFVSWNDAEAYASWAGLRLPNWAECCLAAELKTIERVDNDEWVSPYPANSSNRDWVASEMRPWFDQSRRMSFYYSFHGNSYVRCWPIYRSARGPGLGFRCACDAH